MGSNMTKCGLEGELERINLVPTVVGKIKKTLPLMMDMQRDYFIGEEALAKRGLLDLNFLMANRIIRDLEDVEKFLKHCIYNEIRVDCDTISYPFVLTEPTFQTRTTREKLGTIIFESCNANSLLLCNQAVLSMYTSGRTTGLLFDCGKAVSNSAPIFEGFQIPQGSLALQLGGTDLDS